jgi:hypothetical protein
MATEVKPVARTEYDDLTKLSSSELQIKRFEAEGCNNEKLRQAICIEEARRIGDLKG